MSKNRNVATKIVSESLEEYIKDNLKEFISIIVLSTVAVLPSFIKSISTIWIEVRLSVILFIVSSVLILVLWLLRVIRSNRKLRVANEDLCNPKNDNVIKFSQGDIVIRQVNRNKFNTSKLTVIKTTSSEVICRTTDNKIISYSPEELCTGYESQQIFLKEEREAQGQKEANDRFLNEINSWNR